jgi:hypothetical protein
VVGGCGGSDGGISGGGGAPGVAHGAVISARATIPGAGRGQEARGGRGPESGVGSHGARKGRSGAREGRARTRVGVRRLAGAVAPGVGRAAKGVGSGHDASPFKVKYM